MQHAIIQEVQPPPTAAQLTESRSVRGSGTRGCHPRPCRRQPRRLKLSMSALPLAKALLGGSTHGLVHDLAHLIHVLHQLRHLRLLLQAAVVETRSAPPASPFRYLPHHSSALERLSILMSLFLAAHNAAADRQEKRKDSSGGQAYGTNGLYLADKVESSQSAQMSSYRQH